jgi:hypothetical protein
MEGLYSGEVEGWRAISQMQTKHAAAVAAMESKKRGIYAVVTEI